MDQIRKRIAEIDYMHGPQGTGPRWPGAVGRRCRVWEVTWTVRDESAWSRVLQDVTAAVEWMPGGRDGTVVGVGERAL